MIRIRCLTSAPDSLFSRPTTRPSPSRREPPTNRHLWVSENVERAPLCWIAEQKKVNCLESTIYGSFKYSGIYFVFLKKEVADKDRWQESYRINHPYTFNLQKKSPHKVRQHLEMSDLLTAERYLDLIPNSLNS